MLQHTIDDLIEQPLESSIEVTISVLIDKRGHCCAPLP
jgi:hypothetical protein